MENLNIATTIVNPCVYGKLLTQARPVVIKTEAENERALVIVEKLMLNGNALSPEEGALLELLSRLIADFEAVYYQPGQATPSEILQELMAAHGLEQKDLMEVFGSRSRISEAVNGKRPFSKAQAKALSAYFNVSAELFL